jgi:hypothetical protein
LKSIQNPNDKGLNPVQTDCLVRWGLTERLCDVYW